MRKQSKRNEKASAPRFVVCVDNEGYAASLEVGKIYRVLADDDAADHGYLRVVDESGEDYGYSVRRFFPIELPGELAAILSSAGSVVASI